MLLKDRVAVITGAASGIGRAGAKRLGREGAIVVVTDRDVAAGEAAAEEIRAAGGRADFLRVDVSVDDDLKKMIDFAIEQHGRIDILHNHAGVQINGTLEEVSPDGMDISYRLNTRAHFFAAKLAVPHMRAQGGGVIINTASNSGVFLDTGMLAYITSKAATIMMTKQMALDYGKDNIRVNALCPGFVDTPFNDPYMAQMGGREALERYVEKTIPLGRWATVEEIAESILYLACDHSAFMTGHALVIDGGESIA
ncbi:NAD(P)-dependent dehydrogenase (short-subunit alcohol dehydrogenase family) [Mesorhizobium soli]|jgi:NAD(P)-dependent dehydrogenase (short-subunit alcohol dehydrogenase family)|uniref:SDR family NAD(P)-dependent oxidoreductase n=1 Tax=Pseudaminobacter soli (ex Li et al. 2025) TaxID=1295366 RepID=UPI0024767720|nr:glucose 1-dehydrogenase [Mesorhizobium soli]MDH6230544.1 NAD(P)-dependent dehydrogenase (short-subunit alcohol dehydrogenase family) [Mesorhizobium soli]